MTIREVIHKLSKYPIDTQLLIDSNGRYCALQESDIRFIHRSKLDNNIIRSVNSVINNEFEYLGAFKVR